MNKAEMTQRLERAFPAEQAGVLAEVIHDAYNTLVKASDFNELKAIVAELAEAQKRTDQRVAELAEAQRQTADQLRDLVGVVRGLAIEVSSLSRTMSYSLENEAYRLLPALLQQRFGLEIEQKFVRTEINGEEINLFGRARRNGQTVLVVGESKLRLDMRTTERQEVFDQLERKVAAVREAYPDQEIMPVLITHYARPAFLQEAEARGVQVFQSFDW